MLEDSGPLRATAAGMTSRPLGQQAGEHQRLEEEEKRESSSPRRPPPSSRARQARDSQNCPLPLFLGRRDDGSLTEQADHTAQQGVPAGERKAGITLLQRGGVLERVLHAVKRQHQADLLATGRPCF